MILAVLFILPIMLAPSLAAADCTGSGLTWDCAAGTTIAQVGTAYSSASDGAIFTFRTGSYTWTSGSITLSNTKGATFICEAVATCDITKGSNTIFYMDTLSGNNTKTYRVSGFEFLNSTGGYWLWFYGAGTVNNLRVDHNTFTNFTGETILLLLGEESTLGRFYGLMDHNTVTGTTESTLLVKLIGPLDPANVPSALKGTANNFFVEDNTIDFDTVINDGFGCIDGWNSAGFVWRYNTAVNCRIVAHGVSHNGGILNYEVYRNALSRDNGLTNCYRTIHHQGSGEAMVFDNTLTCSAAISSQAIALLHYRDGTPAEAGYSNKGQCDGDEPTVDGNTSPTATHRGYPCWVQPGRAPAGGSPQWGTLSPMAFFRNTNTADSAKVDVDFGCPWLDTPYCTEHVKANRDYYNAVSATAQTSSTSPFNGTTGIGHGTLANRPTTCTHTTAPDGDEGGGVMYWATDQGSWNVSGDGRGSGVLYRCSATNTWTVHYTPYTYPHPLQGFVPGSGAGLRGAKGLGLF